MSVRPAIVQAGGYVTVDVSGFQPNEQLITIGPLFGSNTFAADAGGSLTQTYRLEKGLAPATYMVDVRGGTSMLRADVSLLVVPASPSVSVSPDHGHAGDPVTVTGSGFLPGEIVFVNGPVQRSVSTDAGGSFVLTASVQGGLVPTIYTFDARGSQSNYFVTTPFELLGPPVPDRQIVNISPATVQAGSATFVSAQTFNPGENVTFILRSSRTTAVADATGRASASLTIVPTEEAVRYFVLARGDQGNVGFGPLVITRPTPRISLSADSVHPGEGLTVTGSGFLGNEAVTLVGYFGQLVQTVANGAGNFSAVITVNLDAPAGNRPVEAFSPSHMEAFGVLSVLPPSTAQPCVSSSTNLDRCSLAVGDITLQNDSGPVDDLIRDLGGTYFTHASIYVGNGLVAEATCPGIQGCSLADQVSLQPVTAEGAWTGAGLIDWVVLRPSTSDAVKQNAASYATSKALQSNPEIPYSTDFDHPDTDDKFYCSSLVWKAYLNGGVDLKALVVDRKNHLSAVAPVDLWMSIGEGKAVQVQGRRGLGTRPDPNRRLIAIYSPAHLLLTDGAGRRTGFDSSTGEVLNEIPGTVYSAPPTHFETIAVADFEGTWKLSVQGIATGTYTLVGSSVDPSNPTSQSLVRDVTPGSLDTILLKDGAGAEPLFHLVAAPVSAADDYTALQDTALVVTSPGVLSNDSDSNGLRLSAVLNATPKNGVVLLSPDGSIHYTPFSGFTGTDTFTYKANNGLVESALAAVSVTVLPASGGGGTGGGGLPEPGATPELDSLMLFGAGLSGLSAYAAARLRSRRRQ